MRSTTNAIVLAVLTAVSISVVSGCSGYRQPVMYSPYPSNTSHASLSLEIRATQKQAGAIVQALLGAMTSDQPRGLMVQVSARPGFNSTGSGVAGVDVYVDALNDARTKANAIALKEGVALSPVRAVHELVGDARGMYSQPQGPHSPLPSLVRTIPNQPFMLSVEYEASGARSNTPRVISVIGLSQAPYQRTYDQRDAPQIVAVEISVADDRFGPAIEVVRSEESLVRQVIARLGLPPSAVTPTRVEAYSR